MFKKIYLITISALTAAMLSAQPTIEFNDFGLENGTQVSLRGASTIIPIGEGGENQTWDYSDLNPSGNITLDVHTAVSPDGQPAADSYPTATHVFEPFNVNNTDAEYKRFSDDKLEMLGIHYNPNQTSTPKLIDYTDPRTELEFPLTYGATFSDTYANEQGNSIEDYHETAEFTATVDAWGTMILPSGTFEDVLRVRYDVVGDFTTFGSSSEEIDPFTETIYAYYTAGIPSPLIRIAIRDYETYSTFSRKYYDGNVLSTDNAEDVKSTLLYPSPVSDILRVELGLHQSTDVHLDVFDITGKRVLSQNKGILPAGKNSFTIPVSTLADGVYLTVIQTASGNVTQKFVVQR
ncbi:MAG: T9SS type A sorting domain-containing protein [Cryomorphaceae bacterium]